MLGNISPQSVRVTSQAVVYPGRDHVVEVDVEVLTGRKYRPADLNDLTRVVLIFPRDTSTSDDTLIFDSSTQDIFGWADARITIDLSAYAMPSAVLPAWLIVYDAEHPQGQVLIDNVDATLTIDFRLRPNTGTTAPPMVVEATIADIAAAIAAHVAASDPHTQYAMQSFVEEQLNLKVDGEDFGAFVTAVNDALGERYTKTETDLLLGGKVDDDDSRLTDSRPPTGGAGGVLSGTYPNPGFAVDMATQQELDTVATAKVDKVAGKQLSTEDYTSAEKDKLGDVATGATANASDADLRDRATHTGTQSTATIAGLDTALAGKQAELVSGDNVKTLNGNSVLGSGNLALWDNLLTPAIASGALTLDLTNPAGFAVTLNANITSLSFSNVPTGKFVVFAVAFLQDATGGRTITWPAAVKGSPSQPAAAADTLTIMSFATWDGGTNIYQAA